MDQAAIGMVRRASPFPPIPPRVGTSQITIDVPVQFDQR
jgi:TonB family protein